VFEYQWPLNDKSAEWFLLQEHISEFLGIVSFKRKYPGKLSPLPTDTVISSFSSY